LSLHDALPIYVLSAGGAVLHQHRWSSARQRELCEHALYRAWIIRRVKVEGVLVGVQVVETHQLQPLRLHELVPQHAYALASHELERSLFVNVLLVVTTHEEGRRGELRKWVEDAGLERRCGVEQVTRDEHEVRPAPIGLFDDRREVRLPAVVTKMDIGDLHHGHFAVEMRQPNLRLFDGEG